MDEQERVRDGRVHVVVLPTKERIAKRIDGERDLAIVEGDRGGMQIQSFSFPLDFYLRKQLVSRPQWRAGNKLHQLWAAASLDGHVQFQYRESNGGEPKLEFVPPGAFNIEYGNALAAVRDIPRRKVVCSVCCEGHALSLLPGFSSERTARRRAMPMLIDALDDLVRHFRIDS